MTPDSWTRPEFYPCYRFGLSQPNAVSGTTRPTDGQNDSLILSTRKGALQLPGNYSTLIDTLVLGEFGIQDTFDCSRKSYMV